MEIKKGQIVRCCAGHDGGSFYVVLDVAEKFALIVDGKRRKEEKPKRKSLKHLKMTHTVVELDNLTNRKLRNVLSGFQEGEVHTTEES